MSKGMTVRDLLVSSGGLKESAFSLSAEISRIEVDNKTNIEASVEHELLESLHSEDSLDTELILVMYFQLRKFHHGRKIASLQFQEK